MFPLLLLYGCKTVSKTGKIIFVCSARHLRFYVADRKANVYDINVSNNSPNLVCSNFFINFEANCENSVYIIDYLYCIFIQ
jgi:hypothetical protein